MSSFAAAGEPGFLTQIVNFVIDDTWCVLLSTKNQEKYMVTTLDEVRVKMNDYSIRLGQAFVKDGHKYIVVKIGE